MTYHYRDDLHRDLHNTLCRAAGERNLRTDWAAFERKVMLDAVNDYRRGRDKAPLVVADIERVEQCAVGHTDYGTKFALYCAELVDKP